MTEQKCPYCDKEVAARGRKNHVRLSTGGGHGEKGEVPDGFENDVQAAENGEEADAPTDDGDSEESASDGEEAGSDASQDTAEVTADTLGDTEPDTPDADDGEEAGYGPDNLPFDPDDDGAIELDGGETLAIRHNGEIVQTDAEAGDWLLITDDGPVLYDPEQNARFEVITE